MATKVTDNFARADGVLGPNWSGPYTSLNSGLGEGAVGIGGILINNQGFGPINAHGGDSYALWAGGQTFANDQYAKAVVKTVAPYTAVLNITACTSSGGNSTYTYTVASGNAATPISGGFLYVKISGMQNSGNNGTFTATTFGSGTFTVANATPGANESGSTGTGICASDAGAGVVVRGTTDGKNCYFFHYGTNSYSGDGRVGYHELWKQVNGVFTILNASTAAITSLPNIGDVVALYASGTKLTAVINNVIITQVTDSSLASGIPGIYSWSVAGPNEYNWSNWGNSGVMGDTPGNNGTTYNAWEGGDFTGPYTQLASDTFLEGTALTQVVSDNFTRANGALGANWVASAGTMQIASNKAEAGSVNARCSAYWGGGQTFNNDQYAEVTIAAINGTCLGGPQVRSSNSGIHGTTGETGYILLIPKTGTSGSLQVQRIINNAGATTISTIAGITPSIGDTFRISAVGTTITIYQNGISKGSVTDSNITTGLPGIFCFAPTGNAVTDCQFSNWAAGGTGAPSTFTSRANQNWMSNASNGISPNVTDASNVSQLWQNTVTWPDNQYAEAILTGNGATCGPGVRISTSSDTGYAMIFGVGSLLKLVKVSAGTISTLQSVAYTFNSGDTLRIEVVGDIIYGKLNGTIVMAFDDSASSPITSGKAGMLAFGVSATSTFKTWKAGQIGGFGISGSAGAVGANVAWSGGPSIDGSVISDSSGNYDTGEVLANGSYTITPTLVGHTFSPVNAPETVSNADITGVDFMSTFTISGNAGLAGATVSYSGSASGSVIADGSGNYSINGLANGSYTITPSKSGYNFLPVNSNQMVNNADISGVNFTAALNVYSVPDCRVTPNDSRNVQGTLTYDVMPVFSLRYWFDTLFNRTEPLPVDSRAAGAPTDSRTADNIPENSRAPKT
jgi:hypothetical protein